eukprot:COSAG02_NODE_29_length_51136_cov_346.293317_16_plen_161_part_00
MYSRLFSVSGDGTIKVCLSVSECVADRHSSDRILEREIGRLRQNSQTDEQSHPVRSRASRPVSRHTQYRTSTVSKSESTAQNSDSDRESSAILRRRKQIRKLEFVEKTVVRQIEGLQGCDLLCICDRLRRRRRGRRMWGPLRAVKLAGPRKATRVALEEL